MQKILIATSLLLAATVAAAAETERYIVSLDRGTDAVVGRGERLERRYQDVLPVSGESVRHRLANLDMLVVDVTPEEAERLRRHPAVRHVESDRVVRAFGTVPAADAVSFDDEEGIPWGVASIGSESAWVRTRGEGVRVGIVDSGFDSQHPDLKEQYRGGYDFVENDSVPQDGSGHGTHVAGTVLGAMNGTGVVGVAPDAELYVLRVLDNDGNGRTSDIVRAIDWAIENELQVLNFSLGSSTSSTLERQAFEKAEAAGILTIAASGNGFNPDLPADGISYPAGYKTVLSVGATDVEQQIGNFSQRGAGLGVVGPGVSVDSSYPTSLSSRVRVTFGSAMVRRNLLEFSPAPGAALEGQIVFCGYGVTPADCPNAAGKIALIERGPAGADPGITFDQKSRSAKSAGAIAAIIFNNVDDNNLSWTLGASSSAHVPTIGVLRSEGLALRALAGTTARFERDPYAFASLSGTSMATPHVTGVAALMLAMRPYLSPADARNALTISTNDLGTPGYDTVFGWGIIDADKGTQLVEPKARRRGVRR